MLSQPNRRQALTVIGAAAAATALPLPVAPGLSVAELREAAEIHAGALGCCSWWDRCEFYAFLNAFQPGWRELVAAAGLTLPE